MIEHFADFGQQINKNMPLLWWLPLGCKRRRPAARQRTAFLNALSPTGGRQLTADGQ
jgi:hypothetical protein